MTGSNGRFLFPFLKYTANKVMPTGKLLAQNIAPIGGELDRGVSISGVNNAGISGLSIGHDTFSTAWKYASLKSQESLKTIEERIINRINNILDNLEKVIKANHEFNGVHAENVNELSLLLLQLRQLSETAYTEKFKQRLEIILPAIQNDKLWKPLQEYQRILDAFSNEPLAKIDFKDIKERLSQSQLEEINKKLKENGYDHFLDAYKYETIRPSWVKFMFDEYTEFGFVDYFLQGNFSGLIALTRIFFPKIRENSEESNLLKDNLTRWYIDPFNSSRKRLANTKPEIIFSEEDKKFMEEHLSFPLILTTSKQIKATETRGELLCTEDLTFGREIDLIVTDHKNENTLKQCLINMGLHNSIKICTNYDVLTILTRAETDAQVEAPALLFSPKTVTGIAAAASAVTNVAVAAGATDTTSNKENPGGRPN